MKPMDRCESPEGPVYVTSEAPAEPVALKETHLELAEIAKLLLTDATICRHLAAVCPTCGERLRHVEALMERFGLWNPEIAVQEGLPAEDLFAMLLTAGEDPEAWASRVDENDDFQTWGVAWVALENAMASLAEEVAWPRARDLALLSAKIAESLGEAYHPDFVADLKARAYAAAAAAESLDGLAIDPRKRITAALSALDRGTGDEAVAQHVWHLLSSALQRELSQCKP
jgi:hypothetical protein